MDQNFVIIITCKSNIGIIFIKLYKSRIFVKFSDYFVLLYSNALPIFFNFNEKLNRILFSHFKITIYSLFSEMPARLFGKWRYVSLYPHPLRIPHPPAPRSRPGQHTCCSRAPSPRTSCPPHHPQR